MSSMVRKLVSITLLIGCAIPVAAQAQNTSSTGPVPVVQVPVVQALPPGYRPGGEQQVPSTVTVKPSAPLVVPMVGGGSEWDAARERLRAAGASPMAQGIERWNLLSRNDIASFSDYSSFLLAYPGFPGEEKMRRNAEKALEREGSDPARVVAYFDRDKPLTNPARAQYAVALFALRRPEALSTAIAAWRGGAMSDASESALAAQLAGKLAPADHDARMDALLWAGAADQAARQIAYVSANRRDLFMARLAAVQGNDPEKLGIAIPAEANADPGWLYNRARQLRRNGDNTSAAYLIANRGPLGTLPLDQTKWVDLQLAVAKDADALTAMRIAAKIDDGFVPGADVSLLGYELRDDYTSLMWLGGLRALWQLNDARSAAPLFWRYGAAARTPQTRSKGFYWAGRALAQAGDLAGANRYFEAAAQYPDQFYGQLATERLGRPLIIAGGSPIAVPSFAERQAFNARPLTQAVREVARESDWPTAVRFFREIADQADSESEHVLVADLARELGRRDLGVILGQAAHVDGHGIYRATSYPLIPVPLGSDWTMIHAISRQESQFAANAVSHAGARGLMQLMPGTAREQAGKIGLAYDPALVMGDASYNLRLGEGYIQRMLRTYGGSYPLAVAAYNAGPGNVNKWLRANGDPRIGEVDWIDWIERIPLSETRNYVQRVLENAVVYEAMNPDKAKYTGPNPLSFHFIGKRTAG